MPNAAGFLTSREANEIRELARDGVESRQIALQIGCSTASVLRHSGSLSAMCDRGERYARIVSNAAAYVPTFGGGR